MAKKERTCTEINVITRLQGDIDDKNTDAIKAYVFDSNARLLSSSAIDNNGVANLHVDLPENSDQIRILVGPKIDEEQIEYRDLIRRGSRLKRVRADALTNNLDITIDIFHDDILCWLASACFVKGNLQKRVLVGGSYVNYPVCNATVEIYEVDPLWIIIPKLPLDVLDRFRDLILKPELSELPRVIETPRPVPIPVPGPLPGPDPVPFNSLNLPTADRTRLNSESKKAISMIPAADELKIAARIGSTQQLQRAMIEFPLIIRPLLCWYFPKYVTMQLIKTTTTDECGKFSTLFFRGCNNSDQPDLYFIAKQRLFGFLNVTIYEPKPVSCYTWWDYKCGTDVNLVTNHAWAQTCSPCPPVVGPNGSDRWVAFMSIGVVGLNRIYGTSQDLEASTNSTNLGLRNDNAPWGGTLLPRIEFANGLKSAGVRYYQMSWRRGNSGSFTPLTGTINHYYRHDVVNSDGISLPVWTPETLGPKEIDDGSGAKVPYMFSIPYASDAPAGVWDVPPHVTEIKEHFASAKFFTSTDAIGTTYSEDGVLQGTDVSGIYQLKLDLFDAHGQPVNIAALGITYAVPVDPDSTSVVETVNAADLGLVHGNSMIINLHISNNACYAGIDAPTIGATGADPCCGVLKYSSLTDTVSMGFSALHPNNFATYAFDVARGGNLVVDDDNPVASSSSPITRQVSYMLNHNLPVSCAENGCSVAGFGESLYVWAKATDGWSRLSYLDDRTVSGFVLSNQ